MIESNHTPLVVDAVKLSVEEIKMLMSYKNLMSQ